jgi:hypothetical protein
MELHFDDGSIRYEKIVKLAYAWQIESSLETGFAHLMLLPALITLISPILTVIVQRSIHLW